MWPSIAASVDREDTPICHCRRSTLRPYRRSALCPTFAPPEPLHLQWRCLTAALSPSPTAVPSNGGGFSLPRISYTRGAPAMSVVGSSLSPNEPFLCVNQLYGGDRGTTDMRISLSMSMTCGSCFIVSMTCGSHLTVLNSLGYRSHHIPQTKQKNGAALFFIPNMEQSHSVLKN
jgi:hypothetical protein